SDAAILLGDFNLHHLAWGGPQSRADDLAEELLSITASFGLELLLPQGEITWQRGRTATTIDLIFATTGLQDRLIKCSSQPEWAPIPDHIPVLSTMDLRIRETVYVSRYALNKLEIKEYREAVKKGRIQAGLLTCPATHSDELE